MKKLLIFQLFTIVFLTSCYDYNSDVVYSTFKGHQIIKKIVSEEQSDLDGYFYYKDSINAEQQSLKLYICVVDCNQTLDPILWSENGESFVFQFHGTNSSVDGSDFIQKIVLYNVEKGKVNKIIEMKNKNIIHYFFSDSTFNYVCSDKPDTISLKLK
jgi:hypothetical protein